MADLLDGRAKHAPPKKANQDEHHEPSAKPPSVNRGPESEATAADSYDDKNNPEPIAGIHVNTFFLSAVLK